MVSGTTAMLAPASTRSSAFAHVAGFALGGLGIEHRQRADQEQSAASHLERCQRNAEELDDLQARQALVAITTNAVKELMRIVRCRSAGENVCVKWMKKGTTPTGLTMASNAIRA
jgi:hypothetical protein